MQKSSRFFLYCILVTFYSFSFGQDRTSTTFEKLYSISDLVARVVITDKRYKKIEYEAIDNNTYLTLATIYTFDVIDNFKRAKDLPNEFVSMGGETEEGARITQSGEAYFEIGDEVLVHLIKNPLLYGRLQPIGISGTRAASTFSLKQAQGRMLLIPRETNGEIKTDSHQREAIRTVLDPNDPVGISERAAIDYGALKDLYIDAQSGEEGK